MRVLIEFWKHITDTKNSNQEVESLIDRFLDPLIENGWESGDLSEIIEKIGDLIPEDDFDNFVSDVRRGLRRRSYGARLAISGFRDGNKIVKVRLRIAAQDRSVVTELGKEIADTVLRACPDLNFGSMTLHARREGHSAMAGKLREHRRITFVEAARQHLQFSVPLFVSVIGLLIGGILCYTFKNASLLGDTLWTWYGRLFAPLLITGITTLSAIVGMQGRQTGARHAEWVIAEYYDSIEQ